ncbi:hypothetical protein OKA04_10890 [Luteolibacter flavescens]|uniref:DUF2591 domain-containing protein n=1 Tax=Luteolibacter flavescens TaxID=1859460 RepID=A0ABT3FQI3_9BACT|nr:hypothetical protein [Luteolibacter flavescens]MCW1885235.1 hypothetical protein [Luteolibacter flavescens]
MAYHLHIAKADESEIASDAWQAAVIETEGIRLLAADAQTITNPATGEVIRLRASEGDAEVFFPDQDRWHLVFRWRGNSAAFDARLAETDHPVWEAAVALATALGAIIRGDEGEAYDLQSAKVIPS